MVQNWAAESAGTIAECLDERDLAYKVVRTYKNEPLPDSRDVDKVIILGCPISIRDYQNHDYLKRLYAFAAEIVRRDRPLLGICYSGQMLARILGAEVTRNPVREIGMYTCRLTDEGASDGLFAGFEREFPVFHWHADTFQVPHGATLLAEGEDCRNQAFRKNNAVAIQFHPEPRPDEVPLWCDEFQDELAEEDKTKAEIVADFNRQAGEIRRLTCLLVENFLR
jgi:GMP synthase-like glutamine amidotransferase